MTVPIQNPRAANQLRDQADVQGKLALSLDEIVVATMEVGGDFPEAAWIGVATGWCWGRYATGAPPPNEYNRVQLYNPPDSGVVAFVDTFASWRTQVSTPQEIHFIVSDLDLVTVVGDVQGTDVRRGAGSIAGRTVCHLRSASTLGALANPYWTLTMHGDGSNDSEYRELDLKVILTPGSSLTAWAGEINRDIQSLWRWRERPARRAELAVAPIS
ncbi:MAG: hypothetical protein GWO24_16980 [Akkermansiaceae bacterium]|nr:hypothetical protein [Akkermansiaceae bacterium]